VIATEEQLRHELRTVAQIAKPEAIRPLRVPPPRRRSAAIRWLAPVAAAAAVAGLITGVTVAGHTAARRSDSPRSPVQAPMPKYYVTLSVPRQGGKRLLRADVHTSSNGAATGSIQVPLAGANMIVDGMQAAESDRLFVVSVGGLMGDPNELYALRLAPDGRPDSLTQYPPAVERAVKNLDLTTAVLWPDGTKIAFQRSEGIPLNCLPASSSCRQDVTIAVLSLTTGRLVQWTDDGVIQRGTQQGPALLVGPLAWLNSQKLVVDAQWQGRYAALVLNVSGHGGSLLAHAKPIALAGPKGQPHWTMATMPILMPGANAWVFTEYPANSHIQPLAARVVETSTRTGRVVYSALVPHELQCGDPDSIAQTGFNFLITCMSSPTTTNAFGRVDGNRFTALPPSAAGIAAAAW
jgi:hypothetical protein